MISEAFAPAKINLTLHVTGRRTDGFHLLDSLVAFATVGDRVTVTPAAAWSLQVTGPMAAGVPVDDGNLTLRAARMSDGAPCAITLDKHLPLASGIGGGSADAAATLQALVALDGRALPPDLTRLGADVPVCLRATPCRMSGIGETLDDVPGLPPIHAVLANPRVAVPTPDVFARLTEKSNPPMPKFLPDWPDTRAFARWLVTQRNDLEQPARDIAPVIGAVLSRLTATDGCLLTRMSGSGATCFGIYDTALLATRAAESLRARHPEWWVVTTRLGAGQTIRATT